MAAYIATSALRSSECGSSAVTREARHADAHPHVERHLVDHHRLLDARDQPLGDRLELRRVTRRLRRQHRELVAAQARHQTLRSDRLRQPRAEVAQQLVAEVVAERVVDLLEAIEVEQHHRELLVACLRRRDPPVQVRAEPLAVGQAGQLVGRSATRWSSSPRCLDLRSSPMRYWKMSRT